MAHYYWNALWHPYLESWRFIRTEWHVQECNEATKAVCSGKKTEIGLDFKIQKTDIIGMVQCSWNKSFNKIENDKTTIAERRWNPLNYVLLDHVDIRG